MSDHDFYTAVGASDFSERYYALCRRFPVCNAPLCRLSEGIVSDLLSDLGRTTHRDVRDNSYSCDRILQRGTLHMGFVIQNLAILEFWFWLDQGDQRIGSNYAVIAYESAKLTGKVLPQPPYPRPEFHSVDELRVILAESFDLADSLLSIIGHSGPANFSGEQM